MDVRVCVSVPLGTHRKDGPQNAQPLRCLAFNETVLNPPRHHLQTCLEHGLFAKRHSRRYEERSQV